MSLRSDIEDTIYQYAWGYDCDELDLLAAAFAEDGMLNHAIDGSIVNGRDAIRAWMDEKRQVFRDAGEQPRHMLANVVAERTSDDTATSRCYMTMVVTRSDGSVYLHHAGRYLDELRRVGDRWLFAKRLIRCDRDVDFPHRKQPPVRAAG
jgi:hypothetical protein